MYFVTGSSQPTRPLSASMASSIVVYALVVDMTPNRVWTVTGSGLPSSRTP